MNWHRDVWTRDWTVRESAPLTHEMLWVTREALRYGMTAQTIRAWMLLRERYRRGVLGGPNDGRGLGEV